MPIKAQNDLPAKSILENENIFVMDENRAVHQDIRALQICILEAISLLIRQTVLDVTLPVTFPPF